MPRDDEPPIPALIPEVVFDKHGEPIIAKQIVVKPSPVPRTLAIIMVLFAGIGLASVVLNQQQRDQDNARVSDKIMKVQQQQAAAQQALAQEVTRNRKLILDLLAAKTPGEQRKLLEEFTRQTAANKKSDAAGASRSPVPARSPTPRASPRPSPRPDPAPSPSPSPTCSPLPVVNRCLLQESP